METDQYDLIGELEEAIGSLSGVRFEVARDMCMIVPHLVGGFEIRLMRGDADWIVSFGRDGFHEHFSDAREALNFVVFGLSSSCRLRVIDFLCFRRAIVEKKAESNWLLVSEFGTICFKWRFRPTEIVFRNDLELQ